VSAFERYAEWYDRFNEGKDYAAEARDLLALLARVGVSPRSWLDVGCGTGRHLAALRGHGIAVEGVDRSAEMVAAARRAHPGIAFQVGEASDFRLLGSRDVVSLLFHTFSYLCEDTAIDAALRNAAAHLAPGGALLFDFWHAPGVQRDPPGKRVRVADIEGRRLYRVSTPAPDPDPRVVCVRFEFRWDAPDGEPAHAEVHRMRPTTREELESFLESAGMRVVLCEAWRARRDLDESDWYGVVCAMLR
jgi:SAM-dependent methyltransferase